MTWHRFVRRSQIGDPRIRLRGVDGEQRPVLIAAIASSIAFVASLIFARGITSIVALVAALASGAAAYAPIEMDKRRTAFPPIHDITTDFENPPLIVAGAQTERRNPPDYVGDATLRRSDKTVRKAQLEAFPDIGAHLVSGDVEAVSDIVRGVLSDMNMEIIAEGPIEDGYVIEATYTSFWFGFIDDFVVRVTPDETLTRVDVRSKSRVGLSDFGANATRVRDFLKRLNKAAA